MVSHLIVNMSYFTKYNCNIIQCLRSDTQLYLTLCDSMDCSPPDSSVHGISQARILEWVAISSSRGCSRLRDQTQVSYISCVGRWIDGLPMCHLVAHITETTYTQIYMIYIVKNSSTDYTGIKNKVGLMC